VEIDNTFEGSLFVNLLAIEASDLVVRVNSHLPNLLMSISQERQNLFNDTELVARHPGTWKQVEVPQDGSSIFIKCLRVAPFTIEVSA
jgi:hypothetical protein